MIFRFLLLTLATSACLLASDKKILVVHSYHAGYEWTDELSRGIKTTLGKAGKFELWFEFLNARRRDYPEDAEELRQYFTGIQKTNQFDLIITSDDEALDFVVNRSNGIFGNLPIVFCGVGAGKLTEGLPRERVTGVIEQFPAPLLLDLALKLFPKTKTLYIINDNSPLGRFLKNEFSVAAAAKKQLTVRNLDGGAQTLDEIKAQLKNIPADSLVFTSQFRQDLNKKFVTAADGEYSLASVAHVPVFGPAITKIGNGILAGTPNDGFDHGRLAAEMALKVFAGASPKSIPLYADPSEHFLFDHLELKRWKVRERNLPQGSTVVNKPPLSVRDYWPLIAAASLFACFQTIVIVALGKNILQRKRAQSELSGALADLQVALKKAGEVAELKGRFVANISHELRTPMNGVLGLLGELERTSLEKGQQECVALATSSAQSLLTILNDLLDFSKIESGNLKVGSAPFSLQDELSRLVNLLVPVANEKKLELSLHCDDSMPNHLLGDGQRLRQILLNLLTNALKFSSQGSVRLTVCTLQSVNDSVRLRFEVVDSGVGIHPDQIELLFKPFTQLDDSQTRSVGGTGLGLAISRQLVQLMGGEIGVNSKYGEGSVFWVELPFRVVAGPEKVPPEKANLKNSFAGRTVLVVEDNAVNRLVAMKLLMHLGCQVNLAEDGTKALEMLATSSPELVFMDVQMPGISGLDATREIRTFSGPVASIPIVAMTASSLPGDRETCIAAGMDDYLSKPIDAASVAAILRKWLPARELTQV